MKSILDWKLLTTAVSPVGKAYAYTAEWKGYTYEIRISLFNHVDKVNLKLFAVFRDEWGIGSQFIAEASIRPLTAEASIRPLTSLRTAKKHAFLWAEGKILSPLERMAVATRMEE